MQETEFQFAGAQGTELPARLWLPDGQPRLVLQIRKRLLPAVRPHVGTGTAARIAAMPT